MAGAPEPEPATAEPRQRGVPAVGALLGLPTLAGLTGGYGHATVRAAVRTVLAAERRRLAAGSPARAAAALAAEAATVVEAAMRPPLRRVVNGTGVVLHTNLGRAPLSIAAAALVAEVGAGYSSLELDLATGRRGDRRDLLEVLLCQATGAEAALVANNGAAALLLALTACGRGRSVVVSRGEAIEIGGGFRIPEILELSGARLVDVGTTNRTRVDDYRRATTADTAAWLRVHPSNFRTEGFVERPGTAELAEAAHAARVLLLVDAGSGLLGPATGPLAQEEAMPAAIAMGADLVTGSGDKLLGAGQAGIAAGGAELVDRLAHHPLARALRADKLQLAALQATLLAHLTPGRAEEIPVLRMLATSQSAVQRRVEGWVAALAGSGLMVEAVEHAATAGGGATPGPTLASAALRIHAAHPQRLRDRLLEADPPVLALTTADAVLVDALTVLPGEDPAVLTAVRWAAADV